MHVPSTWSLDGYVTHFPCTKLYGGWKEPPNKSHLSQARPSKMELHRLSALTDNGMLHITLKLRLLPSSGL